MQDNLFSPELPVVIYAVASVVFCVVVYAARLARFDWDAPSMSRPVGDGRIRQVDIDDGPARAAATASVNVMNSMTPGAGASLLVLGVWLVSGLLAATVVPALFGAMSRPSTMNVVLILVASLSIAFAMGRLTVTLIRLGLALALLAAVLAIFAAGAAYLYTFLSGGDSRLFSSVTARAERAAAAIEDFERRQGAEIEKRAEFNACVIQTALSKAGDMQATRSKCERYRPAREGKKAREEGGRAMRDAQAGRAEREASVDEAKGSRMMRVVRLPSGRCEPGDDRDCQGQIDARVGDVKPPRKS